MKKYYLDEIEDYSYINCFEEIQGAFTEDERGRFTYNKDEYEWWTTLAEALYNLNDKGVDVNTLEVNELQDYIDYYNNNFSS